MIKQASENEILKFIQELQTIRLQAQRILSLARQGKLKHFQLDESRMPATVEYVLKVIKSQYPNLDIPYHSRWRHFEVGGVDRVKRLLDQKARLGEIELGKVLYELVILSVLLDAGAGKDWSFNESESRKIFSRSEGLALASLALYQSGILSQDSKKLLRIDAEPLLIFGSDQLMEAFQVTDSNPLEGLQGRVALLNRLGQTLKNKPKYFGEEGRLGNFYTYILGLETQRRLAVSKIFQSVLEAFSEVWPKHQYFHDLALGDVWLYPPLQVKARLGSELVPFHKLSQWLTYSLIEPLEQAGIVVSDLDELTALAEYRNGGLLMDMGLLQVKDQQVLEQQQSADSSLVIEWRALTVALLDELAGAIRQQLGMNASELPLAKILQGGTWEAGRRIARQKRSGGVPPLTIISDGTVF